jgi:hypothetical protein
MRSVIETEWNDLSIALSRLGYCPPLSKSTFESGSRIPTLGQFAFADCGSLSTKSICIRHQLKQFPQPVSRIAGIRSKRVESWRICICILFIPSIDLYSFINSSNSQFLFWMLHAALERDCTVSILRGSAFAVCQSLESIFIPSSIQAIWQSCPDGCQNLANVVLEAGSLLSAQAV